MIMSGHDQCNMLLDTLQWPLGGESSPLGTRSVRGEGDRIVRGEWFQEEQEESGLQAMRACADARTVSGDENHEMIRRAAGETGAHIPDVGQRLVGQRRLNTRDLPRLMAGQPAQYRPQQHALFDIRTLAGGGSRHGLFSYNSHSPSALPPSPVRSAGERGSVRAAMRRRLLRLDASCVRVHTPLWVET